MMKKTIYLLVAFLLCLTSCVEPLSPNDLRPKANETGLVAVTMQLTIPQAELSVGTKANTFSHKPQIESIHAALFGTSGYPQAYSLAEPVNTFATENATIYTFKVLLPVYDGEAHVHIIANGPESIQFSEQTEYSIMSQMSTTNQVGAYWARVVLPNGILPIKDDNGIMTTDENGNFIANDETIEKFRDLTLVRNFAEIKLIVAQGAGISNVSWTLVNDLTYGAVAPFNQDSVVIGDYKTPFIDNYKDYTFDEGTGKMVLTSTNPNVIYDGYAVSSAVNYNVTDNMAFPNVVARGDSVWCYERPDPNKTNPTFILIKANFDADGSGDTCYYRLDLMDESLGGYFPIYRNYKYQIKIDHVGNKGASSPTQAALRNSNGNMSMSAETKTLTDVSDGISRLYIEFVEKTYTNPRDTTTSFWVYYVPDITDVDGNGNPKIDNTLINVGVKQTAVNTALANNSITLDESKSQATGVVNATTGVASAMYFYKFNLKGQTTTDLQSVIEVVADNGLSGANHSKLYRDVTERVMKKMEMNQSLDPKRLEEGVHTDDDPRTTILHIALTDTLHPSMFPLEFYIEDSNRTLNPTGKDGSTPKKSITVPVKLGTSIYDDTNTQSYYYIRTVQWSEYEPMRDAWVQAKNDHLPTTGIIDFTTEFKVIKAQSATTLYVDNDYFNMESVSLSNGGIRLSADQTTVARTATSATVHVEADDDVSWEASVDNGASLIVTRAVGPYSGSHDLSISFDQNNTFSPKVYTVTVTSGSKNYQIAITQKGRSFSVSPNSQEINYYQNSAQITITADADVTWTVSTPSGVSVSPASGTGTQTVTVNTPFNYANSTKNYQLTVTPENTASAQVTPTITQTSADNSYTFAYNAFGNSFNGTGTAYQGGNNANNRITVNLANCRKQNGNSYIQTYYNNRYGTITVTPGNNRKITGVVITYANNYLDDNADVTSGSLSISGNVVTWGVESTSAVTYTSSRNDARITNIQVYYENR